MNMSGNARPASLPRLVRPLTHVWVLTHGMNYDYGSSFGGVFATKTLALKHKATLRLKKGTQHYVGDWWRIERHQVIWPNSVVSRNSVDVLTPDPERKDKPNR